MTRAILGVDFTSSPSRRKPVRVARGRLVRGAFALERLEALPDWPAFAGLLAAPGPWIAGFDFPFGLPREAVRDLAWPDEWRALVAHCAALGRERFRRRLDAYRATRPAGAKYAHRATDRAAASHSPLKLVNPPVALMFLEGAPRLAAADVAIPGIIDGDRARIAIEAYPGLAARAIIGRAPYKSDARREQTPERRTARGAIVARLGAGGAPFGFRLAASRALRAALVADGSGDSLDAVLCAMQAAWCWQRRRRGFGMPRVIDPLEGWIAMAGAR